MAWEPTLYTLIGVGAASISAYVAFDAWRNGESRTARALVALMAILAIWSLVYALQLGFDSLAAQLEVQRLTLAMAGLVPTAWLLFTIYYAGAGDRLTAPVGSLLLVDPAVFFALSITNPAHELVWTGAGMAETPFGPVAALVLGPAYAIHIAYAYIAVGIGITLIVYVGSVTSPMYQSQVGLLAAGATPPLLTHVAFTLGLSPIPNVDLTPFVFAITGTLFGVALFRYDLLERRPVAWRRAINETNNGLIILDEHGTIVESNAAAVEAFDEPITAGAPITTVFPVDDITSVDGAVHSARTAGAKRTYHLRVADLRDHHNELKGHVVILQEVTDLLAYERRLELSNRLLRHNLRNDMNVIAGYASDLEEELEADDMGRKARTIRETAEDLTELSEKVRGLVLGISRFEESRTVDLVSTTETVVSAFHEDHPDCELSVVAPERVSVALPRPGGYQEALWNLLENAVRHNDAETPVVRVEIEATQGETTIRVVDNGPGLPEAERRVFEAGVERPLQHSQGLGLWLAYLYVTEAGGDLEIETSEGGTTIAISYPRRD